MNIKYLKTYEICLIQNLWIVFHSKINVIIIEDPFRKIAQGFKGQRNAPKLHVQFMFFYTQIFKNQIKTLTIKKALAKMVSLRN